MSNLAKAGQLFRRGRKTSAEMQGGFVSDIAPNSSGGRIGSLYKFERTAQRRKATQSAAEGAELMETRVKSADRKIFEAGLSVTKGKQYQVQQVQNQYDAAIGAIQSEVSRVEVAKGYNIKGQESMSVSQMAGDVYGHHSAHLKKGLTTTDNLYGNSIRKIGASALVTAGVVSSLASSRGQQSNAQLYGQAPRPGM
ncbi:hypothetical protein [Anaerospora hongkongensis]|uniref:hypothetical protein n=1 Tax=Anaerospora hongkongensis TaxID=244830 RepID=UPI0028A15BA4|nr:hypothetical protein [Anaerospora hongkongensis]